MSIVGSSACRGLGQVNLGGEGWARQSGELFRVDGAWWVLWQRRGGPTKTAEAVATGLRIRHKSSCFLRIQAAAAAVAAQGIRLCQLKGCNRLQWHFRAIRSLG